MYLAITPDADYIAFGSNESFVSRLIVLNGDGEVLWTKKSLDNMFAVAISFDGMYVVFSSRHGKTYFFSRN